MVFHDELVSQVAPIVRHAGVIMRRYFATACSVQEKDGGELVTQADYAVEQYLKDELHKVFAGAGFCAEESGELAHSSDYQWVIDPIDGTSNFVRKIPYFCSSVALTRNDEPVFGMIYQPLQDELFWATHGQGAYKNGQRLSCDSPELFSSSLISFGLPQQKEAPGRQALIAAARMVIERTGRMRHLGAAALDLAYSASSSLDGAFFAGLRWWDVAAGLLLVREAGGRVTNFQGQPYERGQKFCVAGSPLVHTELVAILSDYFS